jgi:hypothetical protein
MMARVEKKAVIDTVTELKFKLQCKGYYSNQIQDFLFKPYSGESSVSIKQLKDVFENIGFTDKQSLHLSRFLIEPKNTTQVLFSEENSKQQSEIIEQLSGLIGHY